MDLDNYRFVDLTHIIEPETEPRPVHIEQVPAPNAIPGGPWYIMHRVQMTLNHVGTHIEAPYHVCQDGMDVSAIPVESLCGEAAVLDLTFVEPGGIVTLADVRRAAERAGGIHPGDIVLCRFDYDGTQASGRRFEAEPIAFLVDAGMKLMGVDLPGIDLPSSDPRVQKQYNHHQLMDRGICLIELVAHLDALRKPRVTLIALPVPIQGLDSFPIRVLALEEV
jgi:kynurenine formamidase